MDRNWKRAGIGACTALALVAGASLAFAPAAEADTPTSLIGGVTTGVTGIVSGVLGGGSTTPSTSPSSGGVSAGLGSTTVGVTTGNGIGVGVGTGGGSGITVQLGGTTTGATGTVSVTGGSAPIDTTSTTTTTTTTTPASTPAPATLSALSVTAQYATVYPAKDGYRDSDVFTLKGTTSDGQQHVAGGTATLTFGSTTVRTWPITATDQVIPWDGLNGSRIVPGSYVLTVAISDGAGATIAAADRVAVSAKRLADTSILITTRSVSGTHRMAAKPLAGLARDKVYLKVTSMKVTGVHGKQYLVFTHGATRIKVRIKNGTHTSKYIRVPKSFSTYTVSHTWKKGTVRFASFKYRYRYKTLR